MKKLILSLAALSSVVFNAYASETTNQDSEWYKANKEIIDSANANFKLYQQFYNQLKETGASDVEADAKARHTVE